MTQKLVLIEPDKFLPGTPPPPVILLHVMASVLGRDDISVEIVDYNLGETVDEHLSDPAVAVFGISARTGDCLLSAVEISRKIKRIRPDVPIVWGGIHVTSVPEEAIAEDFVDIVVRGDAEETLGELLTAVLDGRPLRNVKGILFKEGSEVVTTDRRSPTLVARPRRVPYEEVDLGRYDTATLWMNTSRGCPFGCLFCCNTAEPAGYRAVQGPRQVVADLQHYLRLLKPGFVFFTDYNFFVDPDRVRDIAGLLIEANLGVGWAAHIVASDVRKLSTEDLELLRESGCTYLTTGQDGSKELMQSVKKPCTHEQVETALERLSEAGIALVTNYIIGLPDETRDDVLSIVQDVKRREQAYSHPVNVYVFFGWPGTAIINRLDGSGYRVPRTMEQWSDVFLGNAGILRFHTRRHRRMVQTVYYIISILQKRPLAVFEVDPGSRLRDLKIAMLEVLKWVFASIARVRWRFEFFEWGFEWTILHALARVRHRMSQWACIRQVRRTVLRSRFAVTPEKAPPWVSSSSSPSGATAGASCATTGVPNTPGPWTPTK